MRNFQFIFSLISIFIIYSFTTSNELVEDYIGQYNTIAVKEMHRTGIPASITLAQGIIESGFGTSSLSKNSNNHFGIKCKGDWEGGKYFHKDDDYENGKLIKSCFRTYKNPEDSYYDHSEFLMVNRRYQPLFELKKRDYKGWAKGLKKCGYATAKHYATTLITTIEKYQLHRYDYQKAEELAIEALIPPKAERIPDAPIVSAEIIPQPIAVAPPPSAAIPENYQAGQGLNPVKKEIASSNFREDVFGRSNGYLEEIRPQIVGRE